MDNPKFVDVDGIRTRYFEAGEGGNVVLIGGGKFGTLYNAYHWSLNFDELCRHFHVYAFDKLGMGFTDNPRREGDYTMAATIEHARGFLRALGIERAALVGHSRGALPAARIAVDHPELAQALIIFDSATLSPEDPCVPMDFYEKLEIEAPAIADRDYVCREPFANSHSRGHITEDFIEELLRVGKLPKVLEARKKMEHLLNAVFLPDVRKKKYETLDMISAGRLNAPAMIVWGANDVSSPLKLGLDLLRIIGAVVERTQFHAFNHAAHYVYRERAREVNELLVNFVKASSRA
ncbi:MAG: hypothetical protein A3G81_27645 [Betaproteobacteria bacterium RIFCSPLOWO2_12_FULL_65_14]|nr:MAG: hypothetical protein A3G81_27645 [Betaproteobacteria bacterium RIFCSPLOWO2_12_FULL_65_14]